MTNYEENLKLVKVVVYTKFRRLANFKNLQDDLEQEGMLGLLKAMNKFDETKGFKFATFAIPCIENAIKTFLRKSTNNFMCFTDLNIDDVDSEDYVPFEETVEDVNENTKNILELQNIRSFVSNLSDIEKKIIKAKLKGMPKYKIAKTLHISTSKIRKLLRSIRFRYMQEKRRENVR